jgi:hypothetical protein
LVYLFADRVVEGKKMVFVHATPIIIIIMDVEEIYLFYFPSRVVVGWLVSHIIDTEGIVENKIRIAIGVYSE